MSETIQEEMWRVAGVGRDDIAKGARELRTGQDVTSPPVVPTGSEVIKGTRIPPECVHDRFLAGESMMHLAWDFHLPPEVIEEAIRHCGQKPAESPALALLREYQAAVERWGQSQSEQDWAVVQRLQGELSAVRLA